MAIRLTIAGGGIGGLAAAVAARRVDCDVQVLEQAHSFSEVGAGIQVGPNVTRIIDTWGLGADLRDVAAQPASLRVRDAVDGRELGRMAFGDAFAKRYGAPYLAIHRADLQGLLLRAARAAGAQMRLEARVSGVEVSGEVVQVRLQGFEHVDGDALVAADGVWSAVRHHVVDDGAAKPSGHIAYRGLARQADLPERLRLFDVNLWLGPRTHVVAYPVRRGELLNIVAIVEAPGRSTSQDWDQGGVAGELVRAMGEVDSRLRSLVDAIPSWRFWSLHGRAPVTGPGAMARGRIALLGDAAHPMLPYLAQGAGMAIEDADAIGKVLADASPETVAAAFGRYAQSRWRRCAQVQTGARRNARIFHASGPMRWGRDLAMKAMGEKLLDQPWLYG